jgi:hypothetical protein
MTLMCCEMDAATASGGGRMLGKEDQKIIFSCRRLRGFGHIIPSFPYGRIVLYLKYGSCYRGGMLMNALLRIVLGMWLSTACNLITATHGLLRGRATQLPSGSRRADKDRFPVYGMILVPWHTVYMRLGLLTMSLPFPYIRMICAPFNREQKHAKSQCHSD